jgi:hypothetical protein
LEGLHRKASGGVTVFLIIADNRLEYFCDKNCERRRGTSKLAGR